MYVKKQIINGMRIRNYLEKVPEQIENKALGELKSSIYNQKTNTDDLLADSYKLIFKLFYIIDTLYSNIDVSNVPKSKKIEIEEVLEKVSNRYNTEDLYKDLEDTEYFDRILRVQEGIVKKVKEYKDEK